MNVTQQLDEQGRVIMPTKKARSIVYKTSGPTYRPRTGHKSGGKAHCGRGRHRNRPKAPRFKVNW